MTVSPYPTNPHRHGPPATRQWKPPQFRQQKRSWNHTLFHESGTFQILGHDITLAIVPKKMGHLNTYWERGIYN